MKPRERVEKTLNHEIPDRCPVAMGYTPEFYSRLMHDLANNFEKNQSDEIKTIVKGDIRNVSVGWSTSYYLDTQPYTDEWGVGWTVRPYETPFGTGHYTNISSHPLAEDSTIENYSPPDPCRPELYQAAEELVQDKKEDYWIVGQVHTTVFETAWALRGMEQMMRDLASDADLANHLLDIPYQYHLTAAKKLVEIGVDMIFLGDDIGGQHKMLLSPPMWRKFLKPLMTSFIEELKDINGEIKVAYHSDGYIEPIIPELIEIGINVLNPVQPASMDPAKIKQEYGEQLSFWGTIDEQHTLPFGTPEDVATEVKTRLDTVGFNGGLIIAPTHAVQLDTPLENFYALVDVVQKSHMTH